MDLQATLAGSFTFHYLEAPRYEEQPLPIGRLLGRNWFKRHIFVIAITARALRRP